MFVNPIFEIKEDLELPDTKSELLALRAAKAVVPFHAKICPKCHAVPGADEWYADASPVRLAVSSVAKRSDPHHHWEPIFIGTNDDPWYDERLSWEGRSDKMTQSYALCLLDYDFAVLNAAFLVHRPGIKSTKKHKENTTKQKAHIK